MYKTVIFDLDGTLLDTLGDLTDACNFICGQRGWPAVTETQVRHMVGNGNAKLVERLTPPAFRTETGLAETLGEFLAYYDAHKMDRTAPYPGVPAALAALKEAGVTLAVFSNKADALCPGLIRHYFGDVFRAVRGKRAGVPAKPDPAGVWDLMGELGAAPETTVYVGDSDVDVLTGHNAGLAVCGVTWGFRGRAELETAGAELLADTGGELAALLLK